MNDNSPASLSLHIFKLSIYALLAHFIIPYGKREGAILRWRILERLCDGSKAVPGLLSAAPFTTAENTTEDGRHAHQFKV